MKEDEAPRITNIVENPAINERVLKNIFAFNLDCLTSSIDSPEIRDMYTGTKGNTQGERKDINPAINARGKVISVIRYYTKKTMLKNKH